MKAFGPNALFAAEGRRLPGWLVRARGGGCGVAAVAPGVRRHWRLTTMISQHLQVI